MENTIRFDLNEIVSEDVLGKIASLESMVVDANRRILEQGVMISDLTAKNQQYKRLDTLSHRLRMRYSEFHDTREKFDFIANFMRTVYCIPPEFDGIYGDYVGLEVYLAVNFYHHRDEVITVANILEDDPGDITDFIRDFVMPYDYDKERIIEFAKNPHGMINGKFFGVTSYWLERMPENTPYDLLMMNPHIVEEDVFELVIEVINRRRVVDRYNLFSIPEYNELISDEQIAMLGETLIGIQEIKHKSIKVFIKNNSRKFTDETLDYLMRFSSSSQYGPCFWGDFPPEYQVKILSSLSFGEALERITSYNCDISDDEKKRILRIILEEGAQ